MAYFHIASYNHASAWVVEPPPKRARLTPLRTPLSQQPAQPQLPPLPRQPARRSAALDVAVFTALDDTDEDQLLAAPVAAELKLDGAALAAVALASATVAALAGAEAIEQTEPPAAPPAPPLPPPPPPSTPPPPRWQWN